MRVDGTSYAHATEAILDMAQTGGGMTCVANVHMVMESSDDPEFQRIVNSAELVTPDGMPLVWMLRHLGIPDASRVYGPDLTPLLCDAAADRGISVGFFGGTRDVLDALVARMKRRFPDLRVAFAHAPPFGSASELEDASTVETIRESGVQLLFVGLGCPKQERWMAAQRDHLDCALVGVGAAFDFLAGRKPKAPPAMQRVGLEWLFRLACEPRRLIWRYGVHNPRFVWRALRQCVEERSVS